MRGEKPGRLLRIDLSQESWSTEEIPESLMRQFIGSRGLNMYRIFREIPAGTDPLGPENKLVFGTGPLNGTLFPGGRFNVSARSPQTGLVGDSNAGGFFGSEMRFAGWDQIVLEGRAPRPVYVFIEDDRIEIRDADHLWGLDTYETHRAIRRELGDPEVQ
ncbi:MAG: aldehyde ferredoxin oxidoreductase N-terminal domain-containing protein, partial [Bacillota bacterium]